MNPTQKAAASAQDALLTLRALAIQGNRHAIEELWRIGMIACDQLDELATNRLGDELGKATRTIARKKTTWPFKLAAVKEIRNAKGNTANPDSFSGWIRLGEDTGIKLENPGKGGTRNFRRSTTSGFAFYVRKQIESDFKTYGKLPDSEILKTRYWAWPYTEGDKLNTKNQGKFLEYIKAAMGITNFHDEGQWMKAATLWLEVTYQGKVNDDDGTLGRWPKDVYARAQQGGRTINEVVLTRLQEGFGNIIKPPTPKKAIG